MKRILSRLQELVSAIYLFSMADIEAPLGAFYCQRCDLEVDPNMKCTCPNRRPDGTWDDSNAAYKPKKKEDEKI